MNNDFTNAIVVDGLKFRSFNELKEFAWNQYKISYEGEDDQSDEAVKSLIELIAQMEADHEQD